MPKTLFVTVVSLILFSCSSNQTDTEDIESSSEENSGSALISETITAHGGPLYDKACYSFTFRDKAYSFKNNGEQFEYSRSQVITDQTVVDLMTNDSFTRTVDSTEIEVSQDQIDNFRESINSVIYFATLPHKLSDASVVSKDLGTTTIKEVTYNVLHVRFTEDGGGKDFEDEYMYWINAETKHIDYLAYTYHVNGGGVRFRSAFNQSFVDGIRFQDYVNYEAEVGTPLESLPSLYEEEMLNELSIIATENIVNLAK